MIPALERTRQAVEDYPFKLYRTPYGVTEVWWDLGCGALCLIAQFAVHELAEDWLLSRIERKT